MWQLLTAKQLRNIYKLSKICPLRRTTCQNGRLLHHGPPNEETRSFEFAQEDWCELKRIVWLAPAGWLVCNVTKAGHLGHSTDRVGVMIPSEPACFPTILTLDFRFTRWLALAAISGPRWCLKRWATSLGDSTGYWTSASRSCYGGV